MKSVVLPISFVFGFFLQTISLTPRPVVESSIDIATCGSPSKDVTLSADGRYIVAMKGWGDINYPISSKNDSAKFFFNQGLSFYYGYHFSEAVASFKESTRFDPTSAMGYWGQALASGPFYNMYVYKMPASVPEIVANMKKNSKTATPKEKELIDAMSRRYSQDMNNTDRKELNAKYGNALKELVTKYPDDSNIKALYIDAVMLQHKWDFWTNDGQPKAWTPELISLCEEVLKSDKHPAVLHYYIHLTEASRQPDRALASADELKDKLPGVAHMVHMSSHMYQRNGLYLKGVQVNDAANLVNNDIEMYAPGLGIGKEKSIHYYAVQSYCAMTAGLYEKGLRVYQRARDRQAAVVPDMSKESYTQFVYMMPSIALTRLGKWDEVLQSARPNESWKYAIVLDDFAKGIAFVRKGDLKSARQRLDDLSEAIKDESLGIRYMPFNSPLQSCRIALNLLTAEILFAEGNRVESIENYKKAVDEEDNLVYREPQDWLIPARQFYGARLLDMKKPAEAIKVYEEDLMFNPGNGWSLTGMVAGLKAQSKMKEAAEYELKARKAFEESDVNAISSVF